MSKIKNKSSKTRVKKLRMNTMKNEYYENNMSTVNSERIGAYFDTTFLYHCQVPTDFELHKDL